MASTLFPIFSNCCHCFCKLKYCGLQMPLTVNQQQQACSFAILALIDGGAEVSSTQIATILASCKIEVEPYWPALYAGLKGKAKDLIFAGGAGGGGGGGGGGAGGAAAGGAEAAKEEEKVEEEEEEIDMGGGMDMFGGSEGGGGGDY
jgi:ribosomal protein L12E/L44/L45/RPP1/RPP2